MKYHTKICTFKEAIKFLMWCRRIHRDYARHPEWCRKWNKGSVEHHKHCVQRYTEIINLIKLVMPIGEKK